MWIEFFLKLISEFKMKNKLEKGTAMKKALIATAVTASFLSGCASIPMESKDQSDMAKQFTPPFQ